MTRSCTACPAQAKPDAEDDTPEASRVRDVVVASDQPGSSEAAPKEHYWGQALQYLERKVEVRASWALRACSPLSTPCFALRCRWVWARRSRCCTPSSRTSCSSGTNARLLLVAAA